MTLNVFKAHIVLYAIHLDYVIWTDKQAWEVTEYI